MNLITAPLSKKAKKTEIYMLQNSEKCTLKRLLLLYVNFFF